MALLDHLTPGEQVLHRFGQYFATTHRVLWYRETPAGEEVAELPYYRLRAVELVREPSHRLMAGGTALAILGFFLMQYLEFFTGPLALAFGIGLVVLGARGKEGYYQLSADNLTKDEQRRWRIPYRGSMEFMAAVGQRSGRRLTEG